MQEPSINELADAAQCLRDGGLVAFPTETVYGLGADASNPVAVRRIFAAKERPAHHPLIVHLAGPEALVRWAREIPPGALRLAGRFWPGPLTLVLRRAPGVPPEVTGGQDTIGVRVPAHPLALALLGAFGGGIAAPSANRFGRVSPTRAEHVRAELEGRVDRILDGGPCRVGVESTILSLANGRARLLRPGGIPLSALQDVLGEEIAGPEGNPEAEIRAPGMLASHYAPATRLEVWPAGELPSRCDELAGYGFKVAVMSIGRVDCKAGTPVFMPGDVAEYARRLYAVLRRLDAGGFDVLLAEEPPDTEHWQAVNDRLRRASCSGDSRYVFST